MTLKNLIGTVILGTLVVAPVLASAANLQSFVNTWNGRYCGTGQCVALAHAWATADGASIPSHAYAYQYGYTSPSGWRWVTNTPTGVPHAGDIVVWGAKASVGVPYGHIAVFYSGNVNSFTSFDQNWPLGSRCHLQGHSYNDVVGWLHRV